MKTQKLSKKFQNRYSDSELNEFNDLLCLKLSICESKIIELENSLKEYTEDGGVGYGGDLMDVSSRQDEKEVLINLLNRQKIYKFQLQNALFRIQNKTYGICVNSGEKISKDRLRIVPTTTKLVQIKKEKSKK